MIKPLRSCAWIGLSLGALAWGLTGGSVRLAAQERGREVHGRLPAVEEEREDVLKRHFNHDKPTFNALVRGDFAPTTAEHQAAIEVAAKWFVYRLTWDESLRNSGTMQVLIDEFEREALQPAVRARDSNDEFRKQFCQQLIIQLKKVLNNDFRANRARGGLMLRLLGRLGEESAGELMVEVLEDKSQFPEVKLFAVQGLQEMFAEGLVRDHQRRCLQALLDFLAAESKVREVTAAPEVGAVRFIRRDIVRALGQARVARTKGDKPVAPALALLRLLVQDDVAPPPSLDERILTISNLTRMSRKQCEEYQPDYAAYYIAQFVMDFAKQSTAAGRGDPFAKYYSALLRQALDGFRTANGGADDIGRYVGTMVNKAFALLAAVDSDQPADTTELAAWLDKTKKSRSLFRGDDKAVVNGGFTMQANQPAPGP